MAEQPQQTTEQKTDDTFRSQPQFSAKQVADHAINDTVRQYCMGYGFGTIDYGYIAVPKISTAKVSTDGLDDGTANIVSYDKTEKDDAYIGQINMLTASSFCGLNGLLWGYNLCSNVPKDLKPLFFYPGLHYPKQEKLPQQKRIAVYPIGPLLDAGEKLFGRMDSNADGQPTDYRRFPPLPGCMCVCANKSAGVYGPGYVWSIIGVAIAADRTRDSNLFIEDANAIQSIGTSDTHVQLSEESVRKELKRRLLNIAKSMVLCGQDQNVIYEKIYLGAKYVKVNEGEYGTALCCAPYVQLPPDAVPSGLTGSDLVDMSITDWQDKLKLKPLPPPPKKEQEEDYNGIGLGATSLTKLDLMMFSKPQQK